MSADPEDRPDAPSDPGAYRNTCLLRSSPRRCPGARTLTDGLHLSLPHSTGPSPLRKPPDGRTAHLLQGPGRGWFPPPHQRQCSLEAGTLRCQGTLPSLGKSPVHSFTTAFVPTPAPETLYRHRTQVLHPDYGAGLVRGNVIQPSTAGLPASRRRSRREPTPSWPTCS